MLTNNRGITEQEEQIRKFLFEHGIAFEHHKRILGDGKKIWIVDFYLPEHNIIIEAKTVKSLDNREKHGIGEHNLGGIYKDLYKLDELISRYNLVGILILTVPYFVFGKTFITNLNEHNIYCINDANQILGIIQKQRVDKINAAFQRLPTMPPEAKKFLDTDLELLNQWVKGKTIKELGLHNMQINRKIRKFIKNTLENEKLDAAQL